MMTTTTSPVHHRMGHLAPQSPTAATPLLSAGETKLHGTNVPPLPLPPPPHHHNHNHNHNHHNHLHLDTHAHSHHPHSDHSHSDHFHSDHSHAQPPTPSTAIDFSSALSSPFPVSAAPKSVWPPAASLANIATTASTPYALPFFTTTTGTTASTSSKYHKDVPWKWRNAGTLARIFVASIIADRRTRNVFFFLLLNMSFMVVEVVYGWWSNSLGLIGDGVHMFFDSSAIILSLVASVIAKWDSNERFSYG